METLYYYLGYRSDEQPDPMKKLSRLISKECYVAGDYALWQYEKLFRMPNWKPEQIDIFVTCDSNWRFDGIVESFVRLNACDRIGHTTYKSALTELPIHFTHVDTSQYTSEVALCDYAPPGLSVTYRYICGEAIFNTSKKVSQLIAGKQVELGSNVSEELIKKYKERNYI